MLLLSFLLSSPLLLGVGVSMVTVGVSMVDAKGDGHSLKSH